MESFAVPLVVADIVDSVDDVSEYITAEDVLCVVIDMPVAASLSDELLPEYVILVWE
jgi:hypothetical protein